MSIKSRFPLLIFFLLVTAMFAVGCRKEAQQSSDQNPEQNRMIRQRVAWDTEEMSEKLAGLVKEKTISQEQADSVVEYLEKQAEERQKLMEERGMEEGQRLPSDQAGPPSDSKRPARGQGDLPSDGQRPMGGNFRGQRGNFLSELVDKGVLTQEQADKVNLILTTSEF